MLGPLESSDRVEQNAKEILSVRKNKKRLSRCFCSLLYVNPCSVWDINNSVNNFWLVSARHGIYFNNCARVVGRAGTSLRCT